MNRRRILIPAAALALALGLPAPAEAVGGDFTLAGCETAKGTQTVPGWLRWLRVDIDGVGSKMWTNPDAPNFDDPTQTVALDFGYVAPGTYSYVVTDSNGEQTFPHDPRTLVVAACPSTTTTAPAATTTVGATTTTAPATTTTVTGTTVVPRPSLPTGVEEPSTTAAWVPVAHFEDPEPSTTAAPTTAVVQTTAPTANTLPATGSNHTPLIGMGVAFLLVGGIATASTNRRRPAR